MKALPVLEAGVYIVKVIGTNREATKKLLKY
jgi:hypothetical protein